MNIINKCCILFEKKLVKKGFRSPVRKNKPHRKISDSRRRITFSCIKISCFKIKVSKNFFNYLHSKPCCSFSLSFPLHAFSLLHTEILLPLIIIYKKIALREGFEPSRCISTTGSQGLRLGPGLATSA